jgi:uncharacterized cupredoxin-like copper-binding protein
VILEGDFNVKKILYGSMLAAGLSLSIIRPAPAVSSTEAEMHGNAGASHSSTDEDGTDGAPGHLKDVSRVVRVQTLDSTFNVKLIQVRAGQTVKFVVTNKSSIPHEFVIASRDEHLEHRKMMQQMAGMTMNDEPNAVSLEPGQTKEFIWKFGRDTEVEFACDIPGHAELGMTGNFRLMP